MKTLQTISTTNLDTVTGGCAACGNPAHQPAQAQSWGQQAGQPVGQWGAQAGKAAASWLRR